RRVGSAAAVPGIEPEEAKNAQIVFTDSLIGIADKPHVPRGNIFTPGEVIEHGAVRTGVKRVDSEIAAQRIFFPVGRESDNRTAAESLHIAAERSDLKCRALRNRSHR